MTIGPLPDPVAAVQAARERHAGADPLAFAVAEALARRAATREGAARDEILRRLQARLQRIESKGTATAAAEDPVGVPAVAALAGLVYRLGRHAETAPEIAVAAPAGPSAPPPAGLRSVAAFRGTWSRLRAEQRLREAAAQVPAHAGPLHSAQVIHRALRDMHALSPGYLDAFFSQLETLMALEQAVGGPGPKGPAAAAPAPTGAAPAPRKARRGSAAT